VVLAVSAEASLPYQSDADRRDASLIEEGRRLISSEAINCTRCHTFRDADGEDDVPTLTGWGSRAWMLGMIHDPTQPRYYSEDNDRMPSFGVEETLTAQQMGLVVDWLRRDWYQADEEDDARTSESIP
jgi:mono/diheme cytochrome c family protein